LTPAVSVSPSVEDPTTDSVGDGGLPQERSRARRNCITAPAPAPGGGGGFGGVRSPVCVASRTWRSSENRDERTNQVYDRRRWRSPLRRRGSFEEQNLLTEHSRQSGSAWESRPRPSTAAPGARTVRMEVQPLWPRHPCRVSVIRPGAYAFGAPPSRFLDPPTGTIPCWRLTPKGDVSATTTTSGSRGKFPVA